MTNDTNKPIHRVLYEEMTFDNVLYFLREYPESIAYREEWNKTQAITLHGIGSNEELLMYTYGESEELHTDFTISNTDLIADDWIFERVIFE